MTATTNCPSLDPYDLDSNGLPNLSHAKEVLPGDIFIKEAWNTHYQPEPVTFKPQLRLICFSKGITTVERMEYTASVHEAMKYLTNALFGGRKAPIVVKRWEMGECPVVLRVPVGLKLKVKELNVHHTWGMELCKVDPILDSSSYPLDLVEVLRIGDMPQEPFSHPAELTAKKLEIECCTEDSLLVKAVPRLTNKWVHFTGRCDMAPFVQMFCDVIQSWKESGREVGTCFTSSNNSKGLLRVLYPTIQQRFPGTRVFKGVTTVQLSTSAEIHITHEQFKKGLVKFTMEVVELKRK